MGICFPHKILQFWFQSLFHVMVNEDTISTNNDTTQGITYSFHLSFQEMSDSTACVQWRISEL